MTTSKKLTMLVVALLTLCVLDGCEQPPDKPDSAEEATAQEPAAEADEAEKASDEPAAAKPSREKTEATTISQIWGAKSEGGVVQLELVDLSPTERAHLLKLFKTKDFPEGGLDYQAVKLPARFAEIEAVDVLTPKGPVQVQLSKLVMNDGPGRNHYWLHTDKSDALPKELGWTLATPAGEMSTEATMRLAEPKPVHAKAAPKLRKAFLGGLEADERDRVAKRLGDKDIKSVSGRFPSPHGQVVTINVPWKEQMPMAQAVFVAKDTGEVTHTVQKPFVGPLGDYETIAVADPDGDGTDGVLLYRSTDGYWVFWLHFDENGKVVVDRLAGFAA